MLRRFEYDHPVYTAEGVAAQERHDEISGVRRTHYCGAYWGWGFHEDGVLSALRACEQIPSDPGTKLDSSIFTPMGGKILESREELAA